MKCRSCNNNIIEFFSLGDMPLVNSFLTKKQITKEKKYDLSVGFCQHCYLVQLMHTVSPEDLFNDYIYFSSTSTFFLKHSEQTANYFKKRFHLTSKSLVLEIASNDGAQLQYFKKLGMQILGIDPAINIAEVANKKGIKTIPQFFTTAFAQKLVTEEKIQADIIFGANVLAHVPEIIDFVRGIKIALKPDGTASFEFPYLEGLLENKFDTIYHEHVFYYSLIALQNLFNQEGLEIYDAEFTPTQGKSLRIFASHPNRFPISKNVNDVIKDEIEKGFNLLQTYQKMEKNIEALKKELLELLHKLKKEGKTIAAYSAPAKGNILLNYFGIGENYLEFLVDKAKAKQGFYTPGTHLLVYPPEKIAEEKPDYLLILCWNISKEVIEQLNKYKTGGGKFVIPIPYLQII